MCGRPGGFLGNILAEIAYSFAMPGYGYASRPQASIGFSFSWVVFCRYKFIPTNTLKSRCILPTLYVQVIFGIPKFAHPKNVHSRFSENKPDQLFAHKPTINQQVISCDAFTDSITDHTDKRFDLGCPHFN